MNSFSAARPVPISQRRASSSQPPTLRRQLLPRDRSSFTKWGGARLAPWFLLVVSAGCAAPRVAQRNLSVPPTVLTSQGVVLSRTVVVDAGHGGHDPGTMHNGLREKDLTLDIARRLYSGLNARGLSAVMTRDSDDFIALSRRPAIANRIPADLFVSVHINANRNRRVSGVEVYYPRESIVDGAMAYPPGVTPSEVALPTTTIQRILWDVVLSHSRWQSVKMAGEICRTMRRELGVRCRGVRGARFVVLREAMMPAVLVEVGYVTNGSDASRLASPTHRQAIAEAIADGVASYARDSDL